jgi:hypothetical protein
LSVFEPAWLGQVRERSATHLDVAGFEDGTVVVLWRERQEIVTRVSVFPETTPRQVAVARIFDVSGNALSPATTVNDIPTGYFDTLVEHTVCSLHADRLVCLWDDCRFYLNTFEQGEPNIICSSWRNTRQLFDRIDWNGDTRFAIPDLIGVLDQRAAGGRLDLDHDDLEGPRDFFLLSIRWFQFLSR